MGTAVNDFLVLNIIIYLFFIKNVVLRNNPL